MTKVNHVDEEKGETKQETDVQDVEKDPKSTLDSADANPTEKGDSGEVKVVPSLDNK